MPPVGSTLWRNFRAYQVYGANTDVGKTIFSTLLCRAVGKHDPSANVWYLKPVSTGSQDDADISHLGHYASAVKTQNFYQFDEPISPHLAANTTIEDGVLLQQIHQQIRLNGEQGPGFMLVETAGGPNSPGPSGTLQADLYRPLRLPSIFIADSRLGGISTSISAFESLKLRGYDIEGVAVFEDTYYKNFQYFQSFFKDRGIPVLSVPPPPEKSVQDDLAAMKAYYQSQDASSNDQNGASSTSTFNAALIASHEARLEKVNSMADRAWQHIWYPFTQHGMISKDSITTIDSAYGDYFQTLKTAEAPATKDQSNLLQPTFDGSASWWTQGVGRANSALTLSAAYAAGRYGHVMFAEAIHEPGLDLAERLLKLLDNPRLKKVFFSDNGSTGMEVAIKMALKAACERYQWDSKTQGVEIIGLQGSYHGDTIGAMDMSEPSVYNEKIPWYKGRGFWFECPSVKMRNGTWIVERPVGFHAWLGPDLEFSALQEVFDNSRDQSEQATVYEEHIRRTLSQLTLKEKRRFGALVMEPVVLGAGGMTIADPLFQRTLVKVVRASGPLFGLDDKIPSPSSDDLAWEGLPVVADEVFTGLYRLGQRTSCSLLHVHPDISVHAKLLTGGLIPLSATLASESIFNAFLANNKADALLHGHSYTAHAVGCAVANTSLKMLTDLDENGKWNGFKKEWIDQEPPQSTMTEIVDQIKSAVNASLASMPSNDAGDYPTPKVWSVWSLGFVRALSHAQNVDNVWALGSVLSVALRDEQGTGYTSNAAKVVQKELLKDLGQGWNIHSRVLGNVIYLMTSQTSTEQDVRDWESRVAGALQLPQ